VIIPEDDYPPLMKLDSLPEGRLDKFVKREFWYINSITDDFLSVSLTLSVAIDPLTLGPLLQADRGL